jgi:hypothetical protein
MNAKDSGIVNIHGREYQTVAYRVNGFRTDFPKWTIQTEILHRDEEMVVMKASILDEAGRLIATGHSEERRAASTINKTSALENAETSAIGRALAAFGMGGTEFATADEVANAIAQQKGVHKPVDGAFESLTKERQKVVMDTAILVRDKLQENKDFDAFGLCEHFSDPDEKVALWSLLDSKQRSRIKVQAAHSKRLEASQQKSA